MLLLVEVDVAHVTPASCCVGSDARERVFIAPFAATDADVTGLRAAWLVRMQCEWKAKSPWSRRTLGLNQSGSSTAS